MSRRRVPPRPRSARDHHLRSLGGIGRLFLAIFGIGFLGGCSTIELRPPHSLAGGPLTESTACIYDYDQNGLWYVIFIHADGLLAAVHRHEPGLHLFNLGDDLLFYSRCSGRGETLDIMGQSFSLSQGTVFLCDVTASDARARQLPIPAKSCHGDDPIALAKAIDELSQIPAVSPFLSPEAHARLHADWQASKDSKTARPN